MHTEYFEMVPKYLVAFMFPDEEEEPIQRVHNALLSACSHLSNFHSALALFDTCTQQIKSMSPQQMMKSEVRNWRFTAARDGAMQLFHVAKALGASATALQKAPTLTSYVDVQELRLTLRLFNSFFPEHEGIRHTVGHTAEFAARPNEHAVTGALDIPGFIKSDGGGSIMISDTLHNRTFTATYEGRVVSYDISHDTLANLIKIIKRFCGAFSALEQAAHQWHPQNGKLMRRERPEPPKGS